MSSDQPQSPTEVGTETVPTPTIEELETQLAEALAQVAERDLQITDLQAQVDAIEVIEPIIYPEEDFDAYTAVKLQQGTSLIDLVGDVMSYFKWALGQRGFKVGLEGAIHNTDSAGLERRTGQSHSASFSLADPEAIRHIDPRVTNWMRDNNMFEAVYGKSTYTSKNDILAQQANQAGSGSLFASAIGQLSN